LNNKLRKRIRVDYLPRIQRLLALSSFKLHIPFNYEGLYKWSVDRKLLDVIFTVSREPFNYIDFNKIKVPVYILKPGNAFDDNILSLRNTRSKKDYAVYYARLVPEKGVLEIPLIWYLVSALRPTKLVIVGRFFNQEIYSNFRKLLEDLGIEDFIVYKGFIQSREDLYKLVANAKVLVYPSHYDGFSLVVLETLALGTSVIAYNIPALSDIYSSLLPVKLVEECDIRNMALNTIKVLNKDTIQYSREHESPEVRHFLELHRGWRRVAKAEINLFKRILAERRELNYVEENVR